LEAEKTGDFMDHDDFMASLREEMA